MALSKVPPTGEEMAVLHRFMLAHKQGGKDMEKKRIVKMADTKVCVFFSSEGWFEVLLESTTVQTSADHLMQYVFHPSHPTFQSLVALLSLTDQL